VGIRRIPTHDGSDDGSEESTQGVSDFILAWKKGDPVGIVELTPWLEREVARQLRRFVDDGASPAGGFDASGVIDATLFQVAAGTHDPLPHRAHLMAAVAPLFRRVLIDAVRRLQGTAPICRALFDGNRGQIDVIELDSALVELAAHDAPCARVAELRLFTAMSAVDIAEVLAVPAAAVRSDWLYARAWLHRHAISRAAQVRAASPSVPMDAPRWERRKALFLAAVATAKGERSGYLQRACPDADLRAEVEDLVTHHEESDALLGTEALHRHDARPPDEFLGTDRFRLEHRLGSGGFGVVYRAFDRKRNGVVALKTLSPANDDALYRLKREFRSLADLSHPNLVRLYELFSEGTVWFFTMELIDGVNFLDFVRPVTSATPATCDETRLRSALVQLAEGVLALHQSRRLHRDLKPANVLVARDGALRILDFGLITDLSESAADQSSRIVGTPAYMAPELGTREPLSEASDWYGVGMMLYEALTGRLPFSGGFIDVLVQKRESPAPSPSAATLGRVPADLEELCTALLDPDPARRPVGRDVLRALQRHSPAPRTRQFGLSRPQSPFVGRQAELEGLRAALDCARTVRTTVVTVHGTSGIGKTALVRSFLEELGRDEGNTPLFRARCYEQESVPFKALDGIVDSLATFLRRLPQPEAERLLPRDVLALARLFPVFKQVPAIASARRRVLDILDTQELRRRAFSALRELFGRLGEQTVPVLFIDDLHWGDIDSAVLLSEVLRPPDPPRLLLVGTYRTEEAETSAFLRHILPLRAAAGLAIDFRDVPVTTMQAEAATELARLLLGSDWPDSAIEASLIAGESGGNPFLLDELASYEKTRRRIRSTRARPARKTRRPFRFEEVIRARVAQLSAPIRQVLEAVCVSGQPTDEAVIARAVGLASPDPDIVDTLKQERFVRTRVVADVTMLEPYHDRIREAVVRRLPQAAARGHHGALARELERSGAFDPEALAFHFEAAGDLARAADYALRAGDRAVESLAFDHGASFYSSVLRLHPAHPQQQQVRVRLADALAYSGRGADSATYYLEAADAVQGLEAQDLRRRATQQLLTSGHIQAGLQVMDKLMQAVAMTMPRSRARALASLAWNRAILILRGTRFRSRPESSLSPELLLRLDTCWSVTVGLMFVRPLTALMLQARHVRMALSVGEPYRVARALALDAGFMAASGVKRSRKTESLLAQAKAIAIEIDNPHALAVTTLAEGFVGYFQGRWSHAVDALDRGETMLRETCTGVAWELHSTHLYSLWCLYHLGRVREIERRLEPLLEDVRRRRDLFLEAGLCTMFLTFLAIAGDDPELGGQQLERISELRLDEQFTVQHFWDLEARVLLALYEGKGQAAYQAVRSRSREFTESGLARIQQNRVLSSFWEGRTAVAAAATAPPAERSALIRRAEADARAVHREGAGWGEGLFYLLKAGLAIQNADRIAAIKHLDASQKAFEAADFVGSAAVAGRLRRGQLMGGPEGERMVADARDWFTAQGFANPDRFAAVYVPEVLLV
jgi:hypothetical protein